MRGFRRRALRFLFLALVFWVIWAPLSSVWGRAASEDEWLEASQWEERRFPSLDARVEALGGSLPEDELWYSISGSEGRTFLRGRWSDGPLLGPGAWGAFVLCFGRAGAGQGGVEVLWRRWNTPQAARRVRLGYAGRPLEFLRLGGGLRHETQWLAGRRYSGWAAEGFGWVRAFGDDVSRLAVFAGVERFGLQLRSAPNRVFPSDRTPPLVELGLEGQWRGRLRLVSAWSYVPDRSLSPLERWFWAGGVEWAPREWAQLRAGYRAPVARERFGKGVLSWGLGSRIGPATVSYALLVDQDPSAEELFRHLLSVEVVAPLGPGPDDEGLIPSQGGFVLPDAQGRFVRPDLEVISPNGDGVQDRVRLRGVNLPPGARLILWDRRGAPVWEFTPKERNVDMEWRGLNADGEPFPDGRYFWRLLDGAGREYAHGVLAVDTRPPALRVQLDPPLLTPARGEQPPVRIDLRAEDDNRVVEWSLAILQGGANHRRRRRRGTGSVDPLLAAMGATGSGRGGLYDSIRSQGRGRKRHQRRAETPRVRSAAFYSDRSSDPLGGDDPAGGVSDLYSGDARRPGAVLGSRRKRASGRAGAGRLPLFHRLGDLQVDRIAFGGGSERPDGAGS
ncbi:MAG: hypothetical protein KatS3mg115_0284 [Candidatus Poribacteria bacterium]|nr:MAG: hypothetical protein KatS3mg115_0284 [Candidatus Poribacteria bacterium]